MKHSNKTSGESHTPHSPPHMPLEFNFTVCLKLSLSFLYLSFKLFFSVAMVKVTSYI